MTLNELYDKIYNDESTKDSNTFIDLFELHEELLDNLTIDGNQEMHNKVMRLTADYAHHLTLLENYRKALPIIDKAIALFQTYSHFNNTDLYKIEFFETLVFDRAMSNYFLKNFKVAQRDLKILTDKFPDNDKYKNWLAATKTHTTNRLINVLWYVVAAIVILTAFVKREDIGILHNIILYVGAAALITAVSAEISNTINKKKLKNGSQ